MADRICTVEDCGRTACSRGWCSKHYQRWRAHGDPHIAQERRPYGSGDNITISGMHRRLERKRGRPREHLCIDCGKPARHWCYDHNDPENKRCAIHGPYSTKLEHYEPRCVSCHKRFDLARLDKPYKRRTFAELGKQRICSIDGCGRNHYGRGLCQKHWRAYRKR